MLMPILLLFLMMMMIMVVALVMFLMAEEKKNIKFQIMGDCGKNTNKSKLLSHFAGKHDFYISLLKLPLIFFSRTIPSKLCMHVFAKL